MHETFMGTYYLIVNDTKNEYINPIYFGDSIKRRGLLNGLHGFGVADLLIYSESDEVKQINDTGYWCGDAIRIVGDDCEQPHAKIKNNYQDVSFYVLANVFENGTDEIRAEIVMQLKSNKASLQKLLSVSYEYSYKKLSHTLATELKNKHS